MSEPKSRRKKKPFRLLWLHELDVRSYIVEALVEASRARFADESRVQGLWSREAIQGVLARSGS